VGFRAEGKTKRGWFDVQEHVQCIKEMQCTKIKGDHARCVAPAFGAMHLHLPQSFPLGRMGGLQVQEHVQCT